MAGENNSLDNEFEALEQNAAVDDELAKLKAELGME
jgi:phage shock protein A